MSRVAVTIQAMKPVFLTLLATLMISGCSTLSYYTQSVVGHSRLMLARTPLDKAIGNAQAENDAELIRQLTLVKRLREFAVSELGLPDNSSYKNYVALTREYPVWVGVAAPEFSLNAKQWCYPIIGCASYRGYFKQASAQRYFSKLAAQGYETSLGGVAAYSTLGWFADPVLPSMLRRGDIDFAETLFHELAHQQLYINGDSSFNEAFATVVGELGALRWLQSTSPKRANDYQASLVARDDFNVLLGQFKDRLKVLYASDQSESDKRSAKQRLFAELPDLYANLKRERWNGKPWFDNWFTRPFNNARLSAFATYREQVPAIKKLLSKCDDDLLRLYRALKKPAKVDGRVQLPATCG